MTPARRRAIFRRLQEANPHPTTELLNDSPFELLVAVMLSAHTTDKSVNAATRKLFPVANTPAAIVKLGVEGVKPYIKTVGLYNTKAQNLIGLAQQIVDKHGGEVPNTREDLEALPGVGRKTASIILNMVFGQNEIAVDTHIFRVANRTGLAPGRRHAKSRTGSSRRRPRSTSRTRTIGCCCTDATFASRECPRVRSASSRTSASIPTRRQPRSWTSLTRRSSARLALARTPKRECPAKASQHPAHARAQALEKDGQSHRSCQWRAPNGGSERSHRGKVSIDAAECRARRPGGAHVLRRSPNRRVPQANREKTSARAALRVPQAPGQVGWEADLTWPFSPDKTVTSCVGCTWTPGRSTPTGTAGATGSSGCGGHRRAP